MMACPEKAGAKVGEVSGAQQRTRRAGSSGTTIAHDLLDGIGMDGLVVRSGEPDSGERTACFADGEGVLVGARTTAPR